MSTTTSGYRVTFPLPADEDADYFTRVVETLAEAERIGWAEVESGCPWVEITRNDVLIAVITQEDES